jgi:methylated-DNA-protein-cysteine methyltransferase-like protein
MPRTDRDERRARILAVVDSIPRGRVASYGQVAREAGLPRHARLVGRVLSALPAGTRLAWHRVVNSAGRISLRPGAALQRRRLAREGLVFTRTGRIDLARFRWTPADEREAARSR